MNGQPVIAITDDDPTLVRAIGRLLSLYGICSETFLSAEAFLDRGNQSAFACIVLDINLGGMSGIELAHRLRNRDWRVPIVFVTAVDNNAIRQEAEDLGCIAYLRKPASARQLIGAIDKATG